MYKKSNKSSIKHLDFFLVDLLAMALAFMLAYLVRFGPHTLHTSGINYRQLLIILLTSVLLGDLMFSNLKNILKRGVGKEVYRVLQLAVGSVAMTTLILYAMKEGSTYSRVLISIIYAFFLVLCFGFRIGWRAVILHTLRLRNKNKTPGNSVSCFVVSDSFHVNDAIKTIESDIFGSYLVTGVAFTDCEPSPEDDTKYSVCSLEDAPPFICRNWIDEVFLFLPDGTPKPEKFVEQCAMMGVTLHTVLNLQKFDNDHQFIESIDDHVMITSAFNSIQPYQAFLKRALDILGGLVGSLLTVLIGIFVGPAIYIASPGPIFFKQERIGRNGKTFKMIKFRSMYLDAEERKAQLMKENRVASGLMFKLDHDPRIIGNKQLPDGTWKTGVGDFIRRTSLDEFPQFFNVLKGDMSMVGTRPPTLEEWEKYDFHHRARMAIKPGITGLWQVSGRSQITDFEEVVKLDTEYIVNFRLTNDIKILFKTLLVVFKRDGSM